MEMDISRVERILESSGYFSNSGWGVTTDNPEQAETLRAWFEEFGAKRPTLSDADPTVVRVANVFDIKAIFETCWPDGVATEPSFEPYPEKIITHLQSEYPYPENVEYLSE